MKLELTKISHNKSLSEETPAYTATLCMDGQPIAILSNHGTGGPDDARALKGKEKALAEAEAYCKALPPLPSEYSAEGLPMDLELWAHMELEKRDLQRQFQRLVKAKILTLDNGQIYQAGYKGLKVLTPAHIEAYVKRNPEAKVLNTMPEAEAFALFQQFA